jgi:hypothetical protein
MAAPHALRTGRRFDLNQGPSYLKSLLEEAMDTPSGARTVVLPPSECEEHRAADYAGQYHGGGSSGHGN